MLKRNGKVADRDDQLNLFDFVPQRSETFDDEKDGDETTNDGKRNEGGNHQESEMAGGWVIMFLPIVSAPGAVIYRS